MGSRALIIGLVLLTGCQASATQPETPEPAPTETTTQTTTSTAATTTSSGAAALDGSLAELRDLAFAYWEAFNAYDTEQVLAYLETDYRLEREGAVQDDIGRLSTFGVKLGISELSPPVMLGTERAEMYIEMSEPLGKRRIRMGFLLVEGDWVIDFAEESE
jgi:hypothetical protein